MLVLGTSLLGTPIMSLQTGAKLAQTLSPLVDPANLKIIAYELEGPLLTEHPTLIRIADVRELGSIGMIIDSQDEFITTGDVIHIDSVYNLHFNLTNMSVIDEDKRKVGKVEDFIVDTDSFVIQQLHIKRGFLRGLSDPTLRVNRSQIVEINDDNIIIKSSKERTSDAISQNLKRAYVNPFRSQENTPQTNTIEPQS